LSFADSASRRYSLIAIALHWLLALALLGALGFGVYMTDLPMSPSRLKLYNYHKWAGITILALSAARLLWRLSHRPPEDVAMHAWQRRAAHATHWALYALFFAVPLSGWAHSSASGFPVVWFGVLPLPDLAPVDRSLAQTLKLVHNVFAFLLASLVVVHVAAALKHHLVDRDGLLRRMWPVRS
jgi:cytochrome b561